MLVPALNCPPHMPTIDCPTINQCFSGADNRFSRIEVGQRNLGMLVNLVSVMTGVLFHVTYGRLNFRKSLVSANNVVNIGRCMTSFFSLLIFFDILISIILNKALIIDHKNF